MSKYARKNKKMNRFERDSERRAKLEYYQKGQGLYLFRNKILGTLMLPKALPNGRTFVHQNEEWEGDDYYMSLVREGMALHVKTIKTPDEERNEMQLEQKLILDQPNTVTVKGTVEQVVVDPIQAVKQTEAKKKAKLEEQKPVAQNPAEVLLTEDPLEGVVILG